MDINHKVNLVDEIYRNWATKDNTFTVYRTVNAGTDILSVLDFCDDNDGNAKNDSYYFLIVFSCP